MELRDEVQLEKGGVIGKVGLGGCAHGFVHELEQISLKAGLHLHNGSPIPCLPTDLLSSTASSRTQRVAFISGVI